MARVIKQGRCNFSVLAAEGLSSSTSNSESGVESEDFNSLSCLMPQPEQEHHNGTSEADEKVDVTVDPVKEARQRADAILAEAKKEAARLKVEAEQIVLAAKKNAEEIESQAYTLGYEQGHKDGEELGRKQFQVGIQHLEKFLENFKKQTATLSSAYEAQMLQICLIVAKAMVEKEISTDKELISRVLARALNKTVEGSSVTIHLNPRDFENLDEDILARLSGPGGNKIEFKEDVKVSRGGCMIETDFGLVDASVESRWLCLIEDIGQQLLERTGVELPQIIKKIKADKGQS